MDHHWDDLVDVSLITIINLPASYLFQNPYQSPLFPYASKFFKFTPPPDAPSWPTPASDETEVNSSIPIRQPRAVRMRYGRGGRVHLDRRISAPRSFSKRLQRSSQLGLKEENEDEDEDPEDEERYRRLEERWRFDWDDIPPIGPEGVEENDRVLVDDYDTTYALFLWSRPFEGLTPYTFRFLRHAMTLHTESDHIHLVTDPTLYVLGPEGRPQGIVPYRLGVPPIIMRRDAQGVVRPFQPGMQLLPQQVHMLAMQNGTPVSMQQLKKMQLPAAAQQMRISSGGGMRPPTVPVSNLQPALQSQPVQLQTGALPARTPTPSRSTPVPIPQHSPPNGIGRPGIAVPHVEVAKTEAVVTPPLANGVPTSPVPSDANVEVVPVRPKSQNVTPQQRLNPGVLTNGYHLAPMANMTALLNSGAYPLGQNGHGASGLSLQQVQNLKSAFANLSASEMAALNGGRGLPASYLMPNMSVQLPSLKLATTRQSQWSAIGPQMQRPASVGGIDGISNGMVSVSPTLSQSVPVRSPSANGQRASLRNGVHVNGLSPNLQSSPSPLQSQSPPRMPITPNMSLASPSLQHSVGSNQNGY